MTHPPAGGKLPEHGNVSAEGSGKVSVPVSDIVNSPKVQRQVEAARELQAGSAAPQEEMPSEKTVPKWVTSWPDWYGPEFSHQDVTVVPKIDYDKLRASAERLQRERDGARAALALAAENEAGLNEPYSEAEQRALQSAQRTEAAESALASAYEECAKYRNLVDRAVKMLWLAIPETREPVRSDSHNPIIAWVADAQKALSNE